MHIRVSPRFRRSGDRARLRDTDTGRMPHLFPCRRGRLALSSAVVVLLALTASVPGAPAATDRSVVLVDRPFLCDNYPQPLDLDLVKVTMTSNSVAQINDAIHLNNGCSGRVGRIEVDTWL